MFDKIRFVVIDVDGTMTDGGIYYGGNNIEIKKFNTRDAAAFWSAKAVGIEPVVITGRSSEAVKRRMKDLGVTLFYQNVQYKSELIRELMAQKNFDSSELGYIGDDLNDLAGMKLAGFRACPSDACPEIAEICDYVSVCKGGEGAVRDIMTYLIKKQSKWDKALAFISEKYSGK